MKTIEQKIMSRVRRIYYLRKLTGPTAFKAYALVALTLSLASFVSLVNVIANMPSLTAPGSVIRFLTAAVVQTDHVVQIILAGLGVLFILMVRDIVRTLKNSAHSRGFAHF